MKKSKSCHFLLTWLLNCRKYKISFSVGVLFSFLLLFSCCSSGEQVEFRYRSRVKKLDKMFSQICDRDNFCGCVQISYQDTIIFNRSYGYSDRDFGISNIPETRFMIGSVTKQMTAAAILLLYDQGKLSLDDKMNRYFPQLSGGGSVSVRELLTHCGGIPRENSGIDAISRLSKSSLEPWFIVVPEFREVFPVFYRDDGEFYQLKKQRFPVHDLRNLQYTFHCLGVSGAPEMASISDGVQYLLKQEKRFGCGVHEFAYSNYGYMILGAVIEKCSNMRYEEFLDESFFKPLEMTQTGFGYHKAEVPLLAQGYYEFKADDFFNPLGQDTDVDMPDSVNSYCWPGSAGMVHSTVGDLIRWQRGLKEILSADAVAQMFRGVCSTKSSSRYGFGTYVTLQQVRGIKKKMFWHDGVIYNFNSIIASFPRDNLQIAILSDQMTGNAFYNWPVQIAEIVFPRDGGYADDSDEFFDNMGDLNVAP